MSTSNTNNNIIISSSSSSSLTHASPNTQACAACKHQRRKCVADCLLAPFFPAHDSQLFLNAHRLFGVKRITNALQAIPDPAQRILAARSIIVESNARAANPVGGCFHVVCELQRQIDLYQAELVLVQNQLALYRAQDEFLYKNNINSVGEFGSFDDVSHDVEIMRTMDDKELEDLDQSLWVEKKLGVKKADELEQERKDEEEAKAASSLVSLITD